MRKLVCVLVALIGATPVAASDFQRVQDRQNFVSLINDRDLTRLGIRLTVSHDGRISGRAFGRRVSGDWTWNRGYFCRDLMVNGAVLDADNCQLVQVKGDTLRFTSDMGLGASADLRLR